MPMRKLMQYLMVTMLGSNGCAAVQQQQRRLAPEEWNRTQVEECGTACHDDRDQCVLRGGNLFDCRNDFNDCVQVCQTHVPRVDA